MRDEGQSTLIPSKHMSEDMKTAYIFTGSMLLAFVLFFILIAFEDGVAFGLIRKMFCRLNRHKFHKKINRVKVKKYYCQYCKKEIDHPKLKMISGGNLIKENKFKF